jgi:ribA/ribD-fused uncharacterized protein
MKRHYELLGLDYERDSKKRNPILGFKDRYVFLSNFFVRDLEMHGLIFKSSEHAFMWHKSEDEEYRHAILTARTPRDAKRLGNNDRLVKLNLLRSDWRDDAVRVKVMYEVLKAKYRDKELWTWLQSTEARYLEETNWWNDIFWGRCNGIGANHLGRLSMCVRFETKTRKPNESRIRLWSSS